MMSCDDILKDLQNLIEKIGKYEFNLPTVDNNQITMLHNKLLYTADRLKEFSNKFYS